jgi:hypothetical protein
MVQATDYLKQQLAKSIDDSIAQLKDKISGDLLNSELSVLYGQKLSAEDAMYIQNIFDELAVDIDTALNECFENCTMRIEGIIDQVDLKSKLEIEEGL